MVARRGHIRRAGKGDFRFGIDIDPPPSTIADAHKDMARRMADMRPAWKLLAPLIGKGLGRNIDSRGASIGERWPEPNRAYSRRKLLSGFGSVDMSYTHALQEAMRSGSAVAITPHFLSVGVRGRKFEYAQAVNFGFRKTKPRKFAGWSDTMRRDASTIVGRYMSRSVSEAAKAMR